MQIREFHEELGVVPDAEGWYQTPKPSGSVPVAKEDYWNNIRVNVRRTDVQTLQLEPFDDRTFVMVCGGPSLDDTLLTLHERADDRSKNVIVCSNKTGEWLLEKGIVPDVHFCIDPKPSKARDFDLTDDHTDYWISVGCHPDVFDLLLSQGRRVYRFLAISHPEDIEVAKEVMQTSGTKKMLMIAGGSMAGLRALTLADGRGFRKVEYFGFDGSIKGDVAYAYDKPRGENIVEVEARDGRVFDSTPVLSTQWTQLCGWLDKLPWIQVSMQGDGFIQHQYGLLPTERLSSVRITDRYKALLAQMHEEQEAFGTSGHKWAKSVVMLASSFAVKGPVTILDYGAGKGLLFKEIRSNWALPMGVSMVEYEPSREYTTDPQPADIVVCTDVMEHVEPECTTAVLDHIQSLTKKIAIFEICLVPAQKNLPDGRNAHINLMEADWWLGQIKKRFLVSEMSASDTNLCVVGQALSEVRRIRGCK